MSVKLHQIVAVVNGKKTRVQQTLTEIYHKLQKGALFDGLSRTYEPLDLEEGERFPAEHKRIQYTVAEAIREASAAMADLLDTIATQDEGNRTAVADLRVGGELLASRVPVTHLLFLEKQLTDLRTFILKIPTLDPGEEWHNDQNTGYWATDVSEGIKTRKTPKNHVKADATKEHPAQVEMYYEDQRIGTWRTVKFSGAIPAKDQAAMLSRVEKLQEAVKQAREEANAIEVEGVKEADRILSYVFIGK